MNYFDDEHKIKNEDGSPAHAHTNVIKPHQKITIYLFKINIFFIIEVLIIRAFIKQVQVISL